MTTLLIGYAIGTAQILLIEWFRQRSRHRSDLRILRAELRRASSYDSRFDIDDPRSAERQTAPRPPTVSPLFADVVTRTEFHITNVYSDSVTQELLLGVLDSCTMFRETLQRFEKTLSEAGRAQGTDRVALEDRARGIARDYDRRLSTFRDVLQKAVADVDERLQLASTWRQLNRPLGRLPATPSPQAIHASVPPN